jgi:hypothetical protein
MKFQVSSTTRSIFNDSNMDITYCPTSNLCNLSEIWVCLRAHVKSKSIQLGSTYITSPYFRISEPAQDRTYKQHTTESITPTAWGLAWSRICGVLKYLSELPQTVSVLFHSYSLLNLVLLPEDKDFFHRLDLTELTFFLQEDRKGVQSQKLYFK